MILKYNSVIKGKTVYFGRLPLKRYRINNLKGWIILKRFITVLAAALSLTLLVSGCSDKPEASASATDSASADNTSQNTSGATVPVQEPSSPVKEPTVDEDGTYHFNVGGEMYEGRLLTDFTAGTVNKNTSYGSYEYADGILSAYTGGSFADSYDNYTGEDLTNADYSDVTYFGVRVVNNQSNDILFGLQGSYGGVSFFMGEEGESILVAFDDGRLYSVPVDMSASRWCATIPANFSGHLLIPASRIYNNPDMNKGEAWIEKRPAFEKLGFHVAGSGSEPVDIAGMLIYTGEMPEAEELPEKLTDITNPEYSYTDEQRMTPFWESDTMYNESMAMIQEGDDIYGTLLFVPERIISVVDVALQKEYVEGVDYQWVEGTNRINWLEGSNIPYFFEGALLGLESEGSSTYVKNWDNSFDSTGRARLGNVLYCVGSFLYEKQICVTYEYDMAQIESQGILYTSYQGDKLPNTSQKLKDGDKLNVLFYGDSIFSGCDASSMYGREPRMPMMSALVEEQLERATGADVNMSNISVGGWTVENGLTALTGNVGNYNYTNSYGGKDLLILSFGMNNGNTSADSFKENTRKIIEQVRTQSPEIEVVLVSCMVPNPEAVGFYGNQRYFGAALKELAAQENCAVVDFFAVHESILKYKSFISTSGNNINHPNDWLIRVYAQNIVAAIIE